MYYLNDLTKSINNTNKIISPNNIHAAVIDRNDTKKHTIRPIQNIGHAKNITTAIAISTITGVANNNRIPLMISPILIIFCFVF